MVRYFRRSGLALLAVAVLLALVAGRSLAQEEPSVVITAPAEGDVLPGPDITVSVALSGFTISLPLEPAREPNKGHLAYFLDVQPFFDLPTPLGDDNIIHSGRLSETFVGVADGEHTVYVCLVYDDNTCIDPTLTDSVRVSVGEPPPTAIPSPEATPTPEPSQETPAPAPATPSPTEEPAPPETLVPTETPRTPSPTAPLPTATPSLGTAPGTAGGESNGDGFPWLYVVVGAGCAGLAAVAAVSVWRVRHTRSER